MTPPNIEQLFCALNEQLDQLLNCAFVTFGARFLDANQMLLALDKIRVF
jgi:hypothetical protein